MKLINIKESGSNNILMWAISNNADIKSDTSLQSIINDELSYIVTLEDVNFFELFRLTQMYRDKLRIIDEKQAEVPPTSELQKLFNGVYLGEDDVDSEEIKLTDLVEHCVNMFINIAMQMNNDSDIISPGTVRMFLPMISRKFTIQIPVYFYDIIGSMSVEEAREIYNKDYPSTLNNIIETESNGVKMKLDLAFLKSTSIIKYDKKYDKYINAIKYSPLKTCKDNKIYKISMAAFSKYDNVSKSDIRINLFNANKETIENSLKRMAHNPNPLEIDFVIQLPIQYMQMLENFFGHDELTIAYESSMSNIIDNGFKPEKFIVSEYISDDNTDEEKIKSYNNAIDNYRIRITEANMHTLKTIPMLLNSKGDVHVSSVFAMLPSIYTTRAVIRINENNMNKLLKHYDPNIKEMFETALSMINGINADINKMN